jgi:hypothetical protein
MWFALLIPVIITGIAYYFWHRRFIWQELFIPLAVGFTTIYVTQLTIGYISMRDIEYNGHVITHAVYYEYWETYVHKTCYTTVSCGKGCTTTVPYDCSYCDQYPAKWIAYDNGGNQFEISKDRYDQMRYKWQSPQDFVQMSRSVNYYGSCGKDGNAYRITWNGNIYASESSVITKSFENKLKVNHSAFSYPDINQDQAASIGLYEYPGFYDTYKQKCILGLDSVKGMPELLRGRVETQMQYINGNLGPKYKCKVFTLLFRNKPIDIAFKQEAYWEGGNQNELVVCIGINDAQEIEWVKPFSWCDNKRIIIDTREDVANLGKLDFDKMYLIYEQNIKDHFKYKSFKDFNYLHFDPTTGQLIWIYLLTLITSLLVTIWCVKNNL